MNEKRQKTTSRFWKIWETAAVSLLVIQDFLAFFSALSILWGWYFIGFFTCLVCMARVFDDRIRLRKAMANFITPNARRYAIYLLTMTAIVIVVNGFVAIKLLVAQ
jgi:hypothetical protein